MSELKVRKSNGLKEHYQVEHYESSISRREKSERELIWKNNDQNLSDLR
jgi:hypothetical protein